MRNKQECEQIVVCGLMQTISLICLLVVHTGRCVVVVLAVDPNMITELGVSVGVIISPPPPTACTAPYSTTT